MDKISRKIQIKGFTLIELSIVLVIIGLIIGGVMTGKMLIQQAETRASASQLQQLETAYRAFQLKYGCIPGDCPNATDFFGVNYIVVAQGCPPSGWAGNGNGNGDGFIDKSSGSTSNGTWRCEPAQAVKSLQLSNLLPSFIKTTSAFSALFNVINGSDGYFYKDDIYNTTTPLFANGITLTKEFGAGSWVSDPALSPVQARSIDEKVDDGVSTKGKFRGMDASNGIGGAIVSNSCSVSGVYNQNETNSCRALYYLTK